MSAHQITISLPAELAHYVDSAPDASSLIAKALRFYQERVSSLEAGPASAKADLLRGFKPATGESLDPQIEQLEMKIDELYEEIGALLSADRPVEQNRIREKRDQLRLLQEYEADLIERRAAARLRFDSEEGHRLLERAQNLMRR